MNRRDVIDMLPAVVSGALITWMLLVAVFTA